MLETASFEDADLIPGRFAYVWFYGAPGLKRDLGDGIEWPVSGWAPYLVWRWTDRVVELWYASTLARVVVPRNHPVLRRARICISDKITPAYVADRFLRLIRRHQQLGMSYPQRCVGIPNFIRGLENFDIEVTPAPDVEDFISGEGEDEMAKNPAAQTDESKPKRGSGAWIREQLVAMHEGKAKQITDEELAAKAREQFGGKTGTSDVAWNRNKLRKDGALPKAERRGPKAKDEKKAA